MPDPRTPRTPPSRTACATSATDPVPSRTALNELDGATTGGSPRFPHKAEVTFAHAGAGDAELTREMYSGTIAKPLRDTDRIFEAMTGCPERRLPRGSTPVGVTAHLPCASGARGGANYRLSPPRPGERHHTDRHR
ncbi:hypothetical protein GCM10027160_37840 [Streptomyces calidiresistens]